MTFDAFFAEQYEGLVKAMYIASGDQQEAEDLAQEAMVRVYERWDRVQGANRPDAYLFQVAFNLNRRRIRRAAIRRRKPALPPPAPGDPAAQVERRATVSAALAKLPRSQIEPLLLVEWLGLTAGEAGRLLGIEAGAVRGRIHRARATLRQELEET